MSSSPPGGFDATQDPNAPTLLIVDDDETFRSRLARAMRRRGFLVREAASYDEALASAQADPPELAIIDLRMPGRSGLEVARDLLALDPQTQALILTGYGSIATAVDALRLGAVNYLPKPADADDILAAFSRAATPPLDPPALTFPTPTLARAEWEHIQRVLSECGGNVSLCARRLGIHRRTLQRKLDKHPPNR